MAEMDQEPTEFGFRCLWCEHTEAWTTETAMQAAAILHIFNEHNDWYREHMGDTPLPMERAEGFGRRFEEWERQC